MNNDVQKLINQTINEFFKKGQSLVQSYDVCHTCKREIVEGHDYTENGGKTWKHLDCHGLIRESDLPDSDGEQGPGDRGRDINKSLPLSGEEKYIQQEPGGTMNAVNLEENHQVEETTEVQMVNARDYWKFFDGSCYVQNNTVTPQKFTCTQFKTKVGISTYIVRISNA